MTFFIESGLNITGWVSAVIYIHTQAIPRWKDAGIVLEQAGGLRLVEENHSFNHQLWYAEDRARRNDLGSDFVMQAKRAIDQYNQARNDRVEMLDKWLAEKLRPAPHNDCAVHSETPGMMIDRLSILALKAYNMCLQTERDGVDSAHRATCMDKLAVIRAQKDQLERCLSHMLTEVQQHTRTFRLYNQFKMYNDPNLNPELYRQPSESQAVFEKNLS